ncbi:twin-arginine translocase subunit TatC [Cruoricaptor ignavus]|uniref:twin-arginine translocase subunit TatC n=1 Tax=Cruoricaptor ignavus TaxID=1118202 RepID=UPI00370DC0B9
MNEDKEMSFMGHIGELRGHLIRCIIAIVIGGILVGFNIEWIMDSIFFGPTRQDFPTFRLVNALSRKFTGQDSVTIPGTFAIQQKTLLQQFNVMMAVSVFGGMVAAFPYIVWEIWRFVSPALHENERKNSTFLINFVWILFICGVLCGYFLILPFAINFGLMFSVSDRITQLFDLSDYTTLFLQIVLGMGLLFLFPILVYFLVNIGILTPKFLKTYRRHAIVLIMVVAAIVTPADVLSMLAAAFPLLVLYEFSILMASRTYRKVQKREVAERAKLTTTNQ